MRGSPLKKLRKFLKSLPLYHGWEWDFFDTYQTGEIILTLKNMVSKKKLKIFLSERDSNSPCYAHTESFNISVETDTKDITIDRIDSEEAAIVDYLINLLKKFDTGGLELTGSLGLAKKVDTRITRIKENYSTLSGGKRSLSINLVLRSNCSWKCCFCPYTRESLSQENPSEEDLLVKVKKLIPKWKKVIIGSVSITGSEPLNHESFIELLNHCMEELGENTLLHFIVQTTGKKLLDENFLKKIKSPERITFEIPLYGHLAELNDEITGCKGSFEDLISLIKNPFLNLRVHTIMLNKNIEHLKQIREICACHGRKHQFIIFYVPSIEALYYENAPALSEVVRRVKEITTDKEFSDFVEMNMQKLPPCISGKKHGIVKKKVIYRNLDGYQLQDSLFGAKNSDLIACVHKNVCSAGRRCPGIYNAYIKLYGRDEFKPL